MSVAKQTVPATASAQASERATSPTTSAMARPPATAAARDTVWPLLRAHGAPRAVRVKEVTPRIDVGGDGNTNGEKQRNPNRSGQDGNTSEEHEPDHTSPSE